MEGAKTSRNRQGALASFIAVLAGWVLDMPLVLVVDPKNAPPGIAVEAESIVVGVFFMTLLYWGNRAGYIGGIAYGFWSIPFFPLSLIISGQTTALIAPNKIINLIFALSLMYFSVRAWREKDQPAKA